MAVQIHPDRPMTVEEFDAWVMLPENADRLYEYVGGELHEKVTSHAASGVGVIVGGLVTMHVLAHRLGHVTGANGGYIVAGERYLPTVACVSLARQPKLRKDVWVPLAPDLVVEVLSPYSAADVMRIKIANYLSAGTVLWIVDADKRRIEIYVPGQPIRVVKMGETLDGGPVLPGFTLALGDLFADVE